MGPAELDLLRSDPMAYLAFAEEERSRVSNPITGWAYFIENYGSHVPAGGGERLPLEMWPAQQDQLAPALNQHDKLIVLKTRRYGFTLLVLHYFAWLAAYSDAGRNSRLVAISNRMDNASKLLRDIRSIFTYLQDQAPWLAVPIGSESKDAKGRPGLDTAKEFQLAERGSSIVALPPNEAARSETVAVLFLDEFARYEGSADPEKVAQAAMPTIEGGGRLIIGSSSGGRHGKGAHFANIWDNAQEGRNGFHPLFIPRSARPGRDQDWFEKQVAIYGLATAQTEYPETPEEAMQGDLSGAAFDPDGVLAVANLGREWTKERKAGKLTPKDDLQDLGIDWGFAGTGWCLRWDLARFQIYIARADQLTNMDAESASNEMMNEAANLGPAVDRVLYDPGGSGAQAHQSFKRIYRKEVRQSYAVSFSKNKRRNVEFIRTLVRRTAEQADLPAEERYGVLGICPDDAALLIEQMKEAKVGKDGGLEKADEQHTLDSLIAAVNLIRKQWENAHRQAD
jgi:hypothetical protein